MHIHEYLHAQTHTYGCACKQAGNTPLHYAACAPFSDQICCARARMLLNAGADVLDTNDVSFHEHNVTTCVLL